MISSVKDKSIVEKFSDEFGCNLEISIKFLIQALYGGSEFIGAEKNGVTYKELPNDWVNRDDFTDEEAKMECDGYDECNKSYEPIDLDINEDNFIVKKSKSFDVNYYYFPDLKSKNKDIKSFLKKLFKKNAIFINNQIKIKNPRGENEDHRGSDHCKILLPFNTSSIMNSPTLETFIKNLYLLKSHKFDKNYEMYCSCIVVNKNESVIITLTFDHGS